MIMRMADSGSCPRCGSGLRYGVKEETASWKVYFDCTELECNWEFFAGRISRSDIDHIDEVYEQAERFNERI